MTAGHKCSSLKYVVIPKRSLVSTIDREKIKKSGWSLKKLPTELTFPGVKIIHHVLVYGPKGST